MAQCTKKAANAQTNLEKADRDTNTERVRDGWERKRYTENA